ncbi:SDR family oxidoreductase [Pseudoduganella armeniaca]|uniref:Short-chain dehydrogenase n=1 Tax=Pseudoduganella armeniaca TaxID=2072590 RepID=A0A2R4CC08_9BURK|nr:SDR family oxidoreductase [Pseudoduganella armeniaca]AVR97139.1 short-chain dehydrogenase [Pseudoduganella armeniaca]
MKRTTKRIVITGASSGIGAATAIAFARQGCQLVLGARGREGLEDVASQCRAAGGEAHIGIVDVTDAGAVARFAAEARAALGGIDLWFSDVGIGVVGKYLDVPIADHRRVIEANLIGHMNDAHAVLPIFQQQGHGIWVNMISIGGFITSPYAAAYAASKFGLRGFSAALRGELRDWPDIHVCDVYPTFVDTPAIYHAGNYTGARLRFPPGALAPEKVADAVVKLARRPRDTTVLGAPESALRLGEFANPVAASLMNRFMDAWSKKAAPARPTTGTMYVPPAAASGIRSGNGSERQRGRQGGDTVLVLGAALAAAALGMRLARRDG